MAGEIEAAFGRAEAMIRAKDAEIERLRVLLLRAYQFISPHSDPMGISSTQMAAEIMRALEQKSNTRDLGPLSDPKDAHESGV